MTSAQLIATAILAAAKAHETSFDAAAAKRSEDSEGKLIEYARFYKIPLRQACEQECGELSEVVYLLLQYTWNDALDWAEEHAE